MTSLLSRWHSSLSGKQKRRVRLKRQLSCLHLGVESLETRMVLSSMSGADDPAADSAYTSSSQTAAASSTTSTVNLASAANVLPVNLFRSQILDGNSILTRGSIAGTIFENVLDVVGRLIPPAGDQTSGILHLEVGPINLNVLGLVVKTSPICLDITADAGSGGALGNLLTQVAGDLDAPQSLWRILSGLDGRLSADDVQAISTNIGAALTQSLNQLFDGAAVAHAGSTTTADGVCPILDLRLGPVNLDLLGLHVSLDNCKGGPVRVQITAVDGQGNLLGNLLCDLTHIADGSALNQSSATDLLGLNTLTAQLANPSQIRLTGNLLGRTFSQLGTMTGTLTPAAGDQASILHLRLEPIHLNLLGLKVDTSRICLDITADSGQGGAIGNLLNTVANSLDGPAYLQDIRNGLDGLLTPSQVSDIERQIGDLVTQALNSVLATAVTPVASTRTGSASVTPILDLSIGPVNLNLLGLHVSLDNCYNGPVKVMVSAQKGAGRVLGNLLTGLLGALNDLNGNTSATSSQTAAKDQYFAAA